MDRVAFILEMISKFISSTLAWSVVVFLLVLVFRKEIGVKIDSLMSIEGSWGKAKFGKQVKNLNGKLIKHENTPKSSGKNTNNSNEIFHSQIVIHHIYSRIEKVIKEKYHVNDAYEMLLSLVDNGKLDYETFIIMDSMRSLKENIQTFGKISNEDISVYEDNANRIIKIIQSIKD